MNKIFIPAICTLAIVTSCGDMLNLEPHSAVSPTSVGSDDVPQLRVGMYWKVQELPEKTTYILDDILGGNLTNKNSTSALALINNTLDPLSPIVEDAWQGSYKAMYQVNNVISIAEGLPESSTKNQVLGEGYYFRAYLYTLLVTHFGDVPLLTKNTIENVARTEKEKVWSQIETDLTSAVNLLSGNSDYYYVSVDAAMALLARVKLYLGKYDEAEKYASLLIDSGRYGLDSFEKIFRGQQNSEIIFAFKCLTADGSKIAISALFYSYNHPNKGSYVYMPAPDVMTLFDATDNRKEITVTTLDNLNFINKYPSGQTGTDPVIISRLAEMYLISAEARGVNTGLARLNDLRVARGLEKIYPTTEAAFKEALMLERRREFVGESHRYYDLVRNDMAVETLGIQPYQTLLPIPEAELQNNSLLTQNPKY